MNIREKKIENAILFFANKTDKKSIGRLQLMKLLWFSDRIHLNRFGRLILNDSYCALPNGPAPSKALDMSKHTLEGSYNVSFHNIQALKDFDEQFFSKSDIKIMDYVWDKFSGMNVWSLRDLSHEFAEWKRFEKELNSKGTPNSYEMIIQDFFTKNDKVDFSDILDDDIIESSMEQFNVKRAIVGAINS